MGEKAKKNSAASNEYEEFFKHLASYSQASVEAWDRLPTIGLYMDQVTSYVNGQLSPFSFSGEGGLTSSMVNNYVKLSYLDRPENKKYSREQIAALYMLCSLKQVLPISTAAALLRYLSFADANAEEALYEGFTKRQAVLAAEAAAETLKSKDGGRETLLRTALDFALRAEAMRLMAEELVGVAVKTDEALDQNAKEKEKQEARAEKEKAEAKKAKEKAKRKGEARVEKAEAELKKAEAEAKAAEARAAKARENAEKITRAKGADDVK